MKTVGQLPDVWACLVRAGEKSQKAKAVHLVICQQGKNSVQPSKNTPPGYVCVHVCNIHGKKNGACLSNFFPACSCKPAKGP